MQNMIDNEKKNIEKIKKKQKQNIEYLIENQMKAELINTKYIEKEKKIKGKRGYAQKANGRTKRIKSKNPRTKAKTADAQCRAINENEN